MTNDERIEAAAKAVAASRVWPDVLNAGAAEYLAELALRRAFPELFSDPATAWLAPWEATVTMCNAANHRVREWGDDLTDAEESALDFEAMRDAHLDE